jgi:hypothetical protein
MLLLNAEILSELRTRDLELRAARSSRARRLLAPGADAGGRSRLVGLARSVRPRSRLQSVPGPWVATDVA